jgi:hypothetical protein
MPKLLFEIPPKPDAIASVAELLERTRSELGAFYLRGQTDTSWGLVPSIAVGLL